MKWLSFILLLSSCTASFRVNVMQPSRRPISNDYKSILVAVQQTSDTYPNDKKAFTLQLVNHLNGKLKENNRFYIVNGADELPLIQYAEGIAPPKAILTQLAAQYKADAILICTNIDIKSDQEFKETRDFYRDDFGNLVPVYASYYQMKNSTSCYFKLYSADKQMIYSKQVKEYHNAVDNYQFTPQEEDASINYLAYKLVENLCYDITPHWKWISRTYYKFGHPDLTEAHQMVEEENFTEAIILWKELTKSKNKKLSGKACYNMAIASEIKGRFDVAKMWLNKAKKNNIKLAFEYEPVLLQREEKVKSLEKEFRY